MFDEEVKQNTKRNRTIWCHEICKKRNLFVKFHTFKDLLEGETKYIQYFRISCEKYCKCDASARHTLRGAATQRIASAQKYA